jgi:hypothetical protein
VAGVQRGVATKDRSRCIDFAYDPELREKTTQKNLGGLLYLLGKVLERFYNRGIYNREVRE